MALQRVECLHLVWHLWGQPPCGSFALPGKDFLAERTESGTCHRTRLELHLTQYVVAIGLVAVSRAASRARALAAVVDLHILSPCCAVFGTGT